ncbi:chloride channel protein [Terrihabitans rhizophilus]|uniref:Chloride channel protein n=1 Tax=Terrihabitans rhizophilus TaxID=3092662 RepID=A0ABU4RR11_9HYPH|nr:chloride channel protein [Terrihabitans sp. PJ23]MDX6807289.1 chloride channel protein [Terrihabitans sp. PJ23]
MTPKRQSPVSSSWVKTWARLRGLVRRRELALVVLAALIGVAGGGVVTLISQTAWGIQRFLYSLPDDSRLSGSGVLATPWMALIPAGGGLVLGLIIMLSRRARPRPAVDPIEANALHGGRMSFTDSVMVAVQTLVSNACGASVGLEAAYTQVSSALASKLGLRFRLRRSDMRLMVGAGAAAGISAAFDAPLTGAFYAFELIIGTYSIAGAAPVMAAALSASLTVRALGYGAVPLHLTLAPQTGPAEYSLFIVLGVVCGLLGIAIMRGVSTVEAGFKATRLPDAVRPMLGGLIVGGLALISPQVLSSGHAALHHELVPHIAVGGLAVLVVLKAVASAVSLGSGFRGGLFFASLFLGALLGKLFAAAVAWLLPAIPFDPLVSAVIGMSALGVAVVGGPLTMTFLVLEMTGDYVITGAALTAAIVSGLTVRELFGYSFSTWRLHLRGETIRSAHDVGWLRNLTVERLMKRGVTLIREDQPLEEIRAAFPLGSAERLIAVNGTGQYAGVLYLPDAFSPDDESARTVGDLLRSQSDVVTPGMTVKEAIAVFDRTEAEELAVVDSGLRCVGLLSESHAVRRYADELDRARAEAFAD